MDAQAVRRGGAGNATIRPPRSAASGVMGNGNNPPSVDLICFLQSNPDIWTFRCLLWGEHTQPPDGLLRFAASYCKLESIAGLWCKRRLPIYHAWML